MHVLRPQFRIEESRALAFAADRGFGVIVAADERGPRGSHVPFVIAQRETSVIVQIHLTARNPLVELADGVRRFLLIVSGDDAYISNDWYASRDNVSTWLYEAVHLSGVAHLRERGREPRPWRRAAHGLRGAPAEAALGARADGAHQARDDAGLDPRHRVSSSTRSRDSRSSTSTRAMRIMWRSRTSWPARRRRGAGGWPSGCGRCGRGWGMTLSSSADEPTGRARHPCYAGTKQTRC